MGMVTAQSPARMSAYLVTREGQELGTFKISKIVKGLKTGFFRVSDLGWREASGWQGLAEIVGASAAPTSDTQEDGSVLVPRPLIEELADTRPWVRFISVVMGIGCALMIPACLLLAVDGARSFFAIFPLATLLLLYPAVKLSNYASNIALLAKSQSLADLALALTEQHRFWRFCGIMLLFLVCLTLLLLIASFVVTRVH